MEISTDFSRQLYSHQTYLQSFALHYTKDTDDADDLVQDTMLKAVRYANMFKQGTNLRAWLTTILKNTFINNYRKAAATRDLVTVEEDLTSHQLKYSATTNKGENTCMMDDLQKALFKLKPEVYTPFMKYFEGFKYHEIAEELNIPIGTVKTRIHVARGILQKNLQMYNVMYTPKSDYKN